MSAAIQPLDDGHSASRAYVARETLVSVVITMAISALMTWVVFGGGVAAERREVLLDFLPQTFMIALMGSLVPGVMARRQVRRRALARRAGPPPKLRSLTLRSFGAAMASTLLFGAIGAALVVALFAEAVPIASLFGFKCAYGGSVALVVTPVAIRAALRDRP
ncbi:hypothetical protein [Sphingosinicella terrae]|uniref:hypothetical protein n=1 Tax=Sphingosinicella terrae TaxID=2172047 RepID=UPI000E0CE91B|nr:hypothetical protein [Sphingosinicella terrae]